MGAPNEKVEPTSIKAHSKNSATATVPITVAVIVQSISQRRRCIVEFMPNLLSLGLDLDPSQS
jgi:hypothetical protein